MVYLEISATDQEAEGRNVEDEDHKHNGPAVHKQAVRLQALPPQDLLKVCSALITLPRLVGEDLEMGGAEDTGSGATRDTKVSVPITIIIINNDTCKGS
jgi:hypothetical protein